MPEKKEYAAQRVEMIEKQVRRRGVTDPAVLAAMQAVPRHEFVAEEIRSNAYADAPLPIGGGQTISQPYIVAAMTAALHLRASDKVWKLARAVVIRPLCWLVWPRTFSPSSGGRNLLPAPAPGLLGWAIRTRTFIAAMAPWDFRNLLRSTQSSSLLPRRQFQGRSSHSWPKAGG